MQSVIIESFCLISDGNLNDVWLLKGTAIEADKTQDGEDCHFVYFSFIQLHGIFMFIGWDLLLQMGMFFARYFRHKDPWWFKMHRAMQVCIVTSDTDSVIPSSFDTY